MPARAMKRGTSGLSAEAFGEIFADPDRYEKELAEFTRRKSEAEDAEAKAGAAMSALVTREGGLDTRETGLDGRLSAVTKRETELEADELDVAIRRQAVVTAEGEVAAREGAVKAREDSLDQRRADAVASVRELLE